jgi:hypothetical protein
MSAVSNVKTSEPIVVTTVAGGASAIDGDRALTTGELHRLKNVIMPMMEAIKETRIEGRALVANLKTQLAQETPDGEGIPPHIYSFLVSTHKQAKDAMQGMLDTFGPSEKMATRCISLCNSVFSVTPPSLAEKNAILIEITQCEAIARKNHVNFSKHQATLTSSQQFISRLLKEIK